MKNIIITGGGGYVGCVLTLNLLKKGFKVTVIDLFLFGDHLIEHQNLKKIKADIRDINLISELIDGNDIVIHLACISNDPSFELNPNLGKSINLDSFKPLVKVSKEKGIKRFIYASSSSVYGVKDLKDVTEEMSLQPLTDYSKYKAECEKILNEFSDDDFTTVTIRPATVCGYSPRQRMDVVVNIFTNLAYHKREISVFGGSQLRPNIHIQDMIDAYLCIIHADHLSINKKIYNVGERNYTVHEIAEIVKNVIGEDVILVKSHSDDNRSYHVSSEKIFKELNFKPKLSIKDAVMDLKIAIDQKKLIDSLTNPNYFNIKTMQQIDLK